MTLTLKTARPTARKAHVCDLCGGPIRPGETYDRQSNLADGRVYDWLTCLPCMPVSSAVWAWVYWDDDGIGTEDADDWAIEHRDDPEHGEAARAYLARRGLDVEDGPR